MLILFVLSGSFLISQLWPTLGLLNARLFRWMAEVQERHSLALRIAFLAYRFNFKLMDVPRERGRTTDPLESLYSLRARDGSTTGTGKDAGR